MAQDFSKAFDDGAEHEEEGLSDGEGEGSPEAKASSPIALFENLVNQVIPRVVKVAEEKGTKEDIKNVNKVLNTAGKLMEIAAGAVSIAWKEAESLGLHKVLAAARTEACCKRPKPMVISEPLSRAWNAFNKGENPLTIIAGLGESLKQFKVDEYRPIFEHYVEAIARPIRTRHRMGAAEPQVIIQTWLNSVVKEKNV